MRALVSMSGGVDSAVSALLMQRAGYEAVGCTMLLLPDADGEDARTAAENMALEFHAFDCREEFREQVMRPFVESYRRGLTPNPCILCNTTMKFGALMAKASALGCEKLVTGHYARTEFLGGRWTLKKGLDAAKDQSYVLYTLTQEQLSRIEFPLGALTKGQVRAIAEEAGLLSAKKGESQDICFVPDGDYAGFIHRETGAESVPGFFTDADGRILGEHRGIEHYTVGQRRGLGIALGAPAYVLAIRPENNTVVLGSDEALFAREVTAENVHFIAGEPPAGGTFRASAKLRYRHREQPCEITLLGEDRVRILFDEPQRAPSPGQSAVFYDGDTVLGGGIIVR